MGEMMNQATTDVSVASADVMVNDVPATRAVTPTALGVVTVPRDWTVHWIREFAATLLVATVTAWGELRACRHDRVS
ncbi:hypothetical protein ACFC3V_20670 [Bacillus velezensis]|uniref:hypothetical protein n=1 Tax=Bacillus velezensis TaxID=492670 RepID=UPI0035D54638